MWDLSSLTRIKPKPLAVEVQDLNHGSPGKFLSKISLIENIRCLIEVFFFRLLFIFFFIFSFFFFFHFLNFFKSKFIFFPLFLLIKLNEKLHCPKFFNMETFKTTL